MDISLTGEVARFILPFAGPETDRFNRRRGQTMPTITTTTHEVRGLLAHLAGSLLDPYGTIEDGDARCLRADVVAACGCSASLVFGEWSEGSDSEFVACDDHVHELRRQLQVEEAIVMADLICDVTGE